MTVHVVQLSIEQPAAMHHNRGFRGNCLPYAKWQVILQENLKDQSRHLNPQIFLWLATLLLCILATTSFTLASTDTDIR